MKTLIAAALLLTATPAMAADQVAFRAEAKVEISADGKPTRVEASGDLPPAIRSFIEQKVASWQFSPPSRDGVVGSGVTYLSLGACAVAAPGGYRLAVDFKGNGPRIASGSQLMPPAYPAAALRQGLSASAIVHYIVEADGRATLEKLEFSDGGTHRRDGFDATLRDWVAGLRYLPEQLAGQPVRTRVLVPVSFITQGVRRGPRAPGPGGTETPVKQTLRDQAERSPECQVAGGAGGLQPVAADSPIRVLTSG